MRRKYVVGGILVMFILVAVVVAAFYFGVGPTPGGTASGDTIDDFPVADVLNDSASDTASADADPPFLLTIDNVEECGMTCRDVTVTLHNNQNETATGTTVFTRIFAGQDNTDTDDIVWEGKEESGTVEAGTSHTTTKRVELSLGDARKIDRENGWVTILTTVQTDERTVTFQDSEQVA